MLNFEPADFQPLRRNSSRTRGSSGHLKNRTGESGCKPKFLHLIGDFSQPAILQDMSVNSVEISKVSSMAKRIQVTMTWPVGAVPYPSGECQSYGADEKVGAVTGCVIVVTTAA